MRAGAITFLAKPVQSAELIGAVREAMTKDASRRAQRCAQADIRARIARLTSRERQVLRLIADGLLNKQIAAELGAAETTIKGHRARILKKMRVRNVSALMGLLYRSMLRTVLVAERVEATDVVGSGSRPWTAGVPDGSRAAVEPSHAVRDSTPATSVAGVLSFVDPCSQSALRRPSDTRRNPGGALSR